MHPKDATTITEFATETAAALHRLSAAHSQLFDRVEAIEKRITSAPDDEVTRLRERVAELEWALEGIFELAYSSRLDTALDLARAIYHKDHQHPDQP